MSLHAHITNFSLARFPEMGDRKRAYDDDDGQRFPKRDRRNEKVIKVLCPYYSAGAVIGKGGEAIKEIKNETGANIQVSKNEVRFPNTDERVISISGDLESMQRVVAFVQEKIRTDKIPPHVKNINTSENDARKATCKMVVPDTSVGKIIGKSGSNIKRLQEEFNVKIGTMKKEEAIEGLRERIISVEADDQSNVDACVAEMVKEVFEDERAHMEYNVDYEAFGCSRGRDNKGGYGGGGRGDDRSGYGGGGGRPAERGGYGGRDSGSGYGGRDGGRDGGYGGRDGGHGGYESEKSYPSSGGYGDRSSYGGERAAGYGGGKESSYGGAGAGGGYSQPDPYARGTSDRYSEPRGDNYSRGSYGPPADSRPRYSNY